MQQILAEIAGCTQAWTIKHGSTSKPQQAVTEAESHWKQCGCSKDICITIVSTKCSSCSCGRPSLMFTLTPAGAVQIKSSRHEGSFQGLYVHAFDCNLHIIFD